MAGGLAGLETGFPDASGSVDRQLSAVYDYLVMLLENLRYILRNLSPENFNETETLDWIGKNIKAETIVSETVITNELYAEYGAIADLTVDELRTDYQKAARYLAGNTAALDYLYIHDEQIDFLTGTVKTADDTPLTEQLHHRGRYFWWKDASMTQMTSMEQTAWPVIVYQYDELLKGTLRFEDYTPPGGTVTKVPTFTLGAGTGNVLDPQRGKGFLRKGIDSFDVWLHTAAGDKGLFIGNDYTDIVGLRKPTSLDFSGWDGGSFSEDFDGNKTGSWTVEFDAHNRPVKFTDGGGHETMVTWE